MDLVDEQDVVGFQIGQDGGQVACLGEDRAGGRAKVHAEFSGDNLSQGGLAEARRAEQQHVIQRLAPVAGGLDEDTQIGLGLLLGRRIRRGSADEAPYRSPRTARRRPTQAASPVELSQRRLDQGRLAGVFAEAQRGLIDHATGGCLGEAEPE